jgi:hypothetical protein
MVTVGELISNFAAACRVIAPNLRAAQVSWSDSEQYDGWDRIGEALLYSLVLEPCEYQASSQGFEHIKTARYGFDPFDTTINAFIKVTVDGHKARFLALSDDGEGIFDSVRIMEDGVEFKFPISRCLFQYCILKNGKIIAQIQNVDLSL